MVLLLIFQILVASPLIDSDTLGGQVETINGYVVVGNTSGFCEGSGRKLRCHALFVLALSDRPDGFVLVRYEYRHRLDVFPLWELTGQEKWNLALIRDADCDDTVLYNSVSNAHYATPLWKPMPVAGRLPPEGLSLECYQLRPGGWQRDVND